MSTTTTTSDRAYIRRAGLAGIIASLLFPMMIVLTTALEWDYMHDQWGWRVFGESDTPYPSGLATGPLGFLQIGNFFISGVLVLIFGQGLVRTLRPGASRAIARVGLAVMGLALMTSAFPTDFTYGGAGDDAHLSWHGWIHGVSFLVLMLSLLISPVAFAVNARRTARWRRWALPTLMVPTVLLAAFLELMPGGFYLLLLVWFAWIGLTGNRLRRWL